MESTPVEIFKEDSNKCLSTTLEDCAVNSSSWVSGYSESRNLTHDDSWEQEGMSPIIPIITAVYSVVFVVGLLGNCLVMYVIIRYGYLFGFWMNIKTGGGGGGGCQCARNRDYQLQK